ncbi:HNH endonuclease [Paraburkholderia sp. NPDC080076]|uniref:HNH endonuclease n=1 Tax=Paraburkholderia sp. NPDC080076 TaxID=3390605 RepID=UPI003D080985
MPNREDFAPAEVEVAYDIAKQVYEERMSKKDARNDLVARLRTKPGTVDAFFAGYKAMRTGSEYNRALGNPAVECFVNGITRDEGQAGRALALRAVMLNIEYYERSNKAAEGRRVFRRDQRALHARLVSETAELPPIFPDEVDEHDSVLIEGALRTVLVNQYERNAEARRKSIAHYGCKCFVCGFDFEQRYGALGRGFIHVHHMLDIASIGAEYEVDPIKDLRPVCPNCHAMLHSERPAMDIDRLRTLIS